MWELPIHRGNTILHGKEGQSDLHGTKGIEGNFRSKPPGAKRAGVNYKKHRRKQTYSTDTVIPVSLYHRVKIS